MIRKMTISDIDEIVELENKIFGSSLGNQMFEIELTNNEMANYFVIDEKNVILGYIGIWIDGENCQILNFLIKEEFRNKGYGKELISYVIDYSSQRGVNVFTLEVRQSNEVAKLLYEKYGFKFSHFRRNYYSNGEDALVYIRQ